MFQNKKIKLRKNIIDEQSNYNMFDAQNQDSIPTKINQKMFNDDHNSQLYI